MTVLLTAKIVAAKLGVSEPTVYQLAHRGVLESIAFSAWTPKKQDAKPRTTIRFTEEAIARFIEQHTRRAAG
jgi:predicted DNA-binding transcriptional regulator AlpA